MEKLGFDLDGGGGDATAANNPQVAKAASRTVDPDPQGKKTAGSGSANNDCGSTARAD